MDFVFSHLSQTAVLLNEIWIDLFYSGIHFNSIFKKFFWYLESAEFIVIWYLKILFGDPESWQQTKMDKYSLFLTLGTSKGNTLLVLLVYVDKGLPNNPWYFAALFACLVSLIASRDFIMKSVLHKSWFSCQEPLHPEEGKAHSGKGHF